MKTDFSIFNYSATSDLSSELKPTAVQASAKKRFGKKIYFIVGAIAIIAIIATAVLVVPQATATTIPLGINYTVGEKLVYAVTTTDYGNFPTTTGGNQSQISQNSTISVEVVSLNQETYTLNYTTTSTILGNPISSSEVEQVNKTDMASFVALLPIELQQNAPAAANIPNNPFLIAFFNQAEAKVGDTWTIPLPGNDSNLPTSLTISFSAIQNLVVPAGTYKVFKMDFSTSGNSNFNNGVSISGQSYLEYGTCKQIESNLKVVLSTASNADLNGYTINTTLVQQIEP